MNGRGASGAGDAGVSGAAPGTAFTEAEYGRLLALAASRYRFVDYEDAHEDACLVWRHDIDYSPHRAMALARLEAAQGVRCVYHVLLSGRYYNVLEPEIGALLREIVALGHIIGLHFDMDVFGTGEAASEAALCERVALQARILASVVGVAPRSLSFHNYVLNRERLVEAPRIEGMLNICAPAVRDAYRYVSDSNGYWRHDSLESLLDPQRHPRLHVLTHPVWWAPEACTPVQRLRRALDGRARAGLRFYIDTMRRDGRLHEVASHTGLDVDGHE